MARATATESVSAPSREDFAAMLEASFEGRAPCVPQSPKFVPAAFHAADVRAGMIPQGRLKSGISLAVLLGKLRRVSSTPLASLERFLDPGCDQGKGGRERGVYIQIGGIEQVGVRSLFQGRNRPVPVGRIAGIEFRQNLCLRAENA